MEINYAELKERAAEKAKQKREETTERLNRIREKAEKEDAQFNGVLQALDKRIVKQREQKKALEIEKAEQEAAEEVRKKYQDETNKQAAFRSLLASMNKNEKPNMERALEKVDEKLKEEKILEEQLKQQEEERKAEEKKEEQRRQIELLKTGCEE